MPFVENYRSGVTLTQILHMLQQWPNPDLTDERYYTLVHDIVLAQPGLDTWESEFLSSILMKQFRAGALSMKQKAVIIRMYIRHRANPRQAQPAVVEARQEDEQLVRLLALEDAE